jgi:hypothetical protein
MEMLFSNQSLLSIDVSVQKNCRHKTKLQPNAFFCSQMLFFAGERFFLRATLFFEKKIAVDGNLSSCLSQADSGQKNNKFTSYK